MPFRHILCLVLCLLMLPLTVHADAREDLDARLGKIFKNLQTVGGAVVIAKENQIIYEYYYGKANLSKHIDVTEKTAFRIASVTKMISAIGIMQLVEEGKLDLDTDLSEYFGYRILNPYQRKPLTLRMLMTHTSSLSSNGGYSRESNGLRHLISTDRSQTSNYYDEEPGSVYRYSNFGAGIMGSLMEIASGQNVNTYMAEHVFAPLNIDAAYSASLLANSEDAASIYKRGGNVLVTAANLSQSEDFDLSVDPDMHYRLTVGRIWIRPRDLCRLGILLMNGGKLGDIRLLQEVTVQQMMADQTGLGGITASSPYGLCINRIENLLDDRMVFGHQGISEDIVANLYFEPESRFVFALVTNGCNSIMDDRIAVLSRRAFSAAWDILGKTSDLPVQSVIPLPAGILSTIPSSVTLDVLLPYLDSSVNYTKGD